MDGKWLLGSVKCCRWLHRPSQDIKACRSVCLNLVYVGLALLRPHIGAMVSGRGLTGRRDHCCCGSCTLARASLLHNYGRTGPSNNSLNLLRPPTRATQSGGQEKSYTELSEEGTLGGKGGRLCSLVENLGTLEMSPWGHLSTIYT
jgi:hypothetical protein